MALNFANGVIRLMVKDAYPHPPTPHHVFSEHRVPIDKEQVKGTKAIGPVPIVR